MPAEKLVSKLGTNLSDEWSTSTPFLNWSIFEPYDLNQSLTLTVRKEESGVLSRALTLSVEKEFLLQVCLRFES